MPPSNTDRPLCQARYLYGFGKFKAGDPCYLPATLTVTISGVVNVTTLMCPYHANQTVGVFNPPVRVTVTAFQPEKEAKP